MFTVFNSESLWSGTDMAEFSRVREILDCNSIKYKHKTSNRLGGWSVRGTYRSTYGSFGTPSESMYHYEVIVHTKDLEQARHLIGVQ